ncbi:MAG TPA: hypothetical protein VF444_06665 [Pseudonocardiaceae bacterium]
MLATQDLDALDLLADRALVMSEDHTVVCEATPGDLLADRNLLLSVNLIYERTRLPGH